MKGELEPIRVECHLLTVAYSLFCYTIKLLFLFSSYLCTFTFTFTFNHLADAFIQSDVQMRRTVEAIRPSREQQYTSAMTSLS